MTLHKKLRIIASITAVAGLALLSPFLYYWHRDNEQRASAHNSALVQIPAPQPQKPETISGNPVGIEIPALSISLEVADGTYNQTSGEWTLTDTKAHYALPSSQPNNESGNTLIYGHYLPAVFKTLHKIQPGSEAVITTDNGYRFVYRYQSSQTVIPNNVDIFAYQGAPRLTVQTCSGAFMQNRQFFYFEFVSVEKI